MIEDRPFIPYGRQLIEDDDIVAVADVLKSDFLTTGPVVEAFENKLTEITGCRACGLVLQWDIRPSFGSDGAEPWAR